jgi:hypothetical protein
VIDPLVQVTDLVFDLGRRRVGRDGDAELTQQADAEGDGVGEVVAVGQAVHLHRGRVGPLHRGGMQVLDGPVFLVGLLEPAHAVEGGLAAGPHLEQRGGVPPVDQRKRGAEQRAGQRVVGDHPGVVGGPPQQLDHPPPLGWILDRVDHGQILLGRGREQIRRAGQPPGHGQVQLSPPDRAQPVQDRLLDPVVPEPHRLLRPRLDHQHTLIQSRSQQPLQHPGRLTGRHLQRARRRPPTETGHHLHHPPRPLRHHRDRRPQQPISSLRPVEPGPHLDRVPTPTHLRHAEHTVPAHRVEQLHRLVRVPRRVRPDQLDQPRRRTRIHMQHLGNHRHQTRPGQIG